MSWPELIRELHDKGFNVNFYADDIPILFIAVHLRILINLMQQAIKVLEEWHRCVTLSVNLDKMEMMLFRRKIQGRGCRGSYVGMAKVAETKQRLLMLGLEPVLVCKGTQTMLDSHLQSVRHVVPS